MATFIDKGKPGDKENLGVWGNARRCWLEGAKNKEGWTLVLQDDALLTHQFHEKLSSILEEIDDNTQVISLYLGGAPSEIIRRIKMQGGDHLFLPYINNEIALMFRTKHVKEMVKFCDERGAVDDKMISRFVESKGWDVYHPLPSLVDHRPVPSLYREYYPDPSRPQGVVRRATWFEEGREKETVIIIAAGEATRWGGHTGVPKHFVRVPYKLQTGEEVEVPLLRRTIQQLYHREIVPIVIAKRGAEGYKFKHARTEYVETDYDKNEDADKFLSSAHLWDKEGRTVILWGDVFFTEGAMDRIFSQSPHQAMAGTLPARDWTLYCRPNGSTLTGTRYGENFALAFYPEHHELMKEHLDKIVKAKKSGEAKRCGGWELYRSLVGVDLNTHTMTWGYEEINDWTEDFDTPEDYDTWIENRQRFKREVRRYP